MKRSHIVICLITLLAGGSLHASGQVAPTNSYERGLMDLQKGSLDEAIADFDSALAANPSNADAYKNRGLAYERKGALDRAIADYDIAIAINANDPRPYMNRAFAYEGKRQYARALEDARKAQALGLRVDADLLVDWQRAAAGQPRIVDAVLGRDRIDRATGYDIVGQTTEFAPDSPKVVCVFKVDGANVGASVKGVWIAEDTGGKAPPNYKIMEKTLILPFINAGSLVLTRPDKGWPLGTYRLEIYFGETLARTLRFTVK